MDQSAVLPGDGIVKVRSGCRVVIERVAVAVTRFVGLIGEIRLGSVRRRVSHGRRCIAAGVAITRIRTSIVTRVSRSITGAVAIAVTGVEETAPVIGQVPDPTLAPAVIAAIAAAMVPAAMVAAAMVPPAVSAAMAAV